MAERSGAGWKELTHAQSAYVAFEWRPEASLRRTRGIEGCGVEGRELTVSPFPALHGGYLRPDLGVLENLLQRGFARGFEAAQLGHGEADATASGASTL